MMAMISCKTQTKNSESVKEALRNVEYSQVFSLLADMTSNTKTMRRKRQGTLEWRINITMQSR